jgi:Flp pilus assembly protein TadD
VLADVAFTAGDHSEALGRYEALLAIDPVDADLLERAGIAALKLGDLNRAAPLIERATSAKGASWRAWNARGALADLDRHWTDADAAYAEALRLAPDEAVVFNNHGWSLLLRGDWHHAIEDLEKAAMVDSKSVRIANNLELARAALAADLPTRRDGESDEAWAERLNDAGVAAEILGDRTRAVAAFTQALEASGRWYVRAANNLEAASRQ